MLKKVTDADARCSALTTAPIREDSFTPARPEYFRPPKVGGDPYFNLTRAWYYQQEKLGRLQMVRLRAYGKQRGVTLIPYRAVAALVQAAAEAAQT